MRLKQSHFNWVKLILDTDLPFQSKAIAMYLATFMNMDHHMAYPSYQRMMKELGVSKQTLYRYLDLLDSAGWITREKGSSNRNTRYFATLPTAIENVLGSSPQELRSSSQEPRVVPHRNTNKQYNKQNNNTPHNPPKGGRVPHQKIIDLYHEILPYHRQVRVWTDNRKRMLAKQWKEYPDMDDWRAYFEHVAESPFLCGQNQKGWKPDLEWLIKPANLAKVLENKYHA